jgi:hypothetical protein
MLLRMTSRFSDPCRSFPAPDDTALFLIYEDDSAGGRLLGLSRCGGLDGAGEKEIGVGFAVRRKGQIVLQDHGDVVWFRDIKVRELK